MGQCLVIVTCKSMIWTLLSIVTSLTALYCISSSAWLVGYDRPYMGYQQIKNNSALSSSLSAEGISTYHVSVVEARNSYQPTIGLYSRCIRVAYERSTVSCATFSHHFGKDDGYFPIAWQVSLVLMGIASFLLVFVTLCSIVSLFKRDFCGKSLFTISGLIQVISGLLLVLGEVAYPIGWSSTKVKYFCGEGSDIYRIGRCSIGWSYIVISVCTVITFATGMLSIQADRSTSKDRIEDEILKGRRLVCVA